MPASSTSICGPLRGRGTAPSRMSGPAAPFSLGEGDDACLLLHGLTGAPAEVRPVGEALARAGFRAVGPLLPGHGTSPQDLEAVTRSDMLDAAREALLSLRGARRVYLCGLSMGALLAVRLAAKGVVRQGVAPVSALARRPAARLPSRRGARRAARPWKGRTGTPAARRAARAAPRARRPACRSG